METHVIKCIYNEILYNYQLDYATRKMKSSRSPTNTCQTNVSY